MAVPLNIAELDRKIRMLSGCVPPRYVAQLLELGHGEVVEREAARGEWFCSLALARRLGEEGRQAEALAMLSPYPAGAWWTAAAATAGLLEGWGRVDEAVEVVRPFAEDGDRTALDFLARLLARHGRAGEGFELVRPHVGDWFLAEALVHVAGVGGFDEAAAELLAACVGTPRGPDNAIDLLAEIRERQGRVDEAVELLRTRTTTSVNGRDQLAELLARHGRVDELRAYAVEDYHGHAAQRLAELLEERGDVEGAVAVYQDPGESRPRQAQGPVRIAGVLERHGRGDEAIEVLLAQVDPADWVAQVLCELFLKQGRAENGLAYLDSLVGADGELAWEFHRLRLPLMAACGRLDEGIREMRAHPEGNGYFAAQSVAFVLAEAGRLGEAVATLEESDGTAALAGYLIEVGRVEDAVALLKR